MIFRTLVIIAWSFLAGASLMAQEKPAPTMGNFDPDAGRYRLQPGDVVEVQYRYTPEYNQTVTIQPDGFVSLEIVGDVQVGELTLKQVRAVLIEKASTRLKDPEVTLLLREFQRPYFVIAGEVNQPGKFEMREKTTALQAVMLAGGFKNSAKTSRILLFRKVNADTAEVKVVDLRKIKRTGDLERNLALQPGDMLLVPESTITKIAGYMKLANLGLYFNPVDILR